jgi:hypothetical protein
MYQTMQITIPPCPPKPLEQIKRIGVCKQRAAEMLDISERSIDKLVAEKRIRPVYVGTKPIFGVDMLRRFVEGKTETNDDD